MPVINTGQPDPSYLEHVLSIKKRRRRRRRRRKKKKPQGQPRAECLVLYNSSSQLLAPGLGFIADDFFHGQLRGDGFRMIQAQFTGGVHAPMRI